MKKIIYISTIVLAFGFVSCNKQDMSPINETNQDIPSWEKGLSTSNDDHIINDDDATDGGGIVDPNFDPDGRSRRN